MPRFSPSHSILIRISELDFLTDAEIREIERAISDPKVAALPDWYLNRRKDMDSGTTHHLITSDLDFAATNDVEREKLVMSWRGYRHMFGLRVRGQRTRTTGRKGGAVGVKKTSACSSPGSPWSSSGTRRSGSALLRKAQQRRHRQLLEQSLRLAQLQRLVQNPQRRQRSLRRSREWC